MKWLLFKRQSTLLKSFRDSQPRVQQHFEEGTGQVFTEKIAPIQTSSDYGWARKASVFPNTHYAEDYRQYAKYWHNSDIPGEDPNVKGMPNLEGCRGARSLTDIVLEFLLQNLEGITPEALEYLPIQVVRRLWHEVNKRCPVSLDTWKMFSKVLHKEDATTLNLFRFRQQIKDPISPLPVYVEPLTSKTFDFISSLSITVGFPTADLVRLSKMTNLGVVEIVNPLGWPRFDHHARPFSAVEDCVVRAWARAAADDGAFPILRILKLWNHPGLTGRSLEYLNCFPSLAIYDVSGCGFDFRSKIEARKHGWTPSLDPNVLGLLDAACVERAMLMQSSLGLKSEAPQKAPALQLFDRAKVRRVPRVDIPKFLTRPEASLPNKNSLASPMDPNFKYAETFIPETSSKLWRLHEWKQSQSHTSLESWEFQTLTTFAKLGELRNDRDLATAGIDVGDQPLAGDQLIPPLPIASLCLGKTIPVLRSSLPNSSTYKSFYSSANTDAKHKYIVEDRLSTIDADPRHLSFIRINPPSMGSRNPRNPVKLPLKVATTIDTATSFNVPDKEKKAEPTKMKKRPGSGIMRNGKKQELANVLGSFLSS